MLIGNNHGKRKKASEVLRNRQRNCFTPKLTQAAETFRQMQIIQPDDLSEIIDRRNYQYTFFILFCGQRQRTAPIAHCERKYKVPYIQAAGKEKPGQFPEFFHLKRPDAKPHLLSLRENA